MDMVTDTEEGQDQDPGPGLLVVDVEGADR